MHSRRKSKGVLIVDLPQKLAFVVQPNRLQGLIWQALLKSQNISAILESATSDLSDCLTQISAAGLTLPDIIILSTETPGLNPYEFCRWCRESFPQITVFLTRSPSQTLAETECRWATKQGAAGFFNGFDRDTLMSNAVASLKEILSTVDESFLDERALLTVLLNVRRQLSPQGFSQKPPRPMTKPEPIRASEAPPQTNAEMLAEGSPSKATAILNDLDWVASGLRALNHNNLKAEIQPREEVDPARRKQPSTLTSAEKIDQTTGPVRRYRGVSY